MAMIPVRILGTSSLLPGRSIPTEELARASAPGRAAVEIERRTGIATRHFLDEKATSASVGAEVLRAALDDAGLAATALKRLIFVSSTGGDCLIPATANAVAAALGLAGSCDCFDLNNACMGFLTAFDLAARSLATGLGPVAVVVVEALSRHLSPERYRPYLVLADAAAAVIFGPGRAGEGVLASSLRNDGALRGSVTLAHAGSAGQRQLIEFSASNEDLTRSALECVRAATDEVLAASGLALDDVTWFLPHQPNGLMLARILEALGVPIERTVPVVREIGSVGAASIAVSLDRLRRTRSVVGGDRILMVGVGAGTASGAILFQVAPSVAR